MILGRIMWKICIGIIVITIAMVGTCIEYMNPQTVVAKVINKERIYEKGGSEHKSVKSFYLIYTDVSEYKITDQFFYGKFNSSNLYGKLEIGKTYEFEIRGFRIPILSMYPNIKSYKEIK